MDGYDKWKRTRAAERLAEALQTEEGRKDLRALYDGLDTDGDGKLTADEWSSGLMASEEVLIKYFSHGDAISKGDHLLVFEKLDADGNGTLSWEEFLQGAQTNLLAISAAVG